MPDEKCPKCGEPTPPETLRAYAREHLLSARDVAQPCETCGGTGVRTYGNTSTWRRTTGGAAMTAGVCDSCWGSGDAQRKWADLRQLAQRDEQLAAQEKAIKRLRQELAEARKAGTPYSVERQDMNALTLDNQRLKAIVERAKRAWELDPQLSKSASCGDVVGTLGNCILDMRRVGEAAARAEKGEG